MLTVGLELERAITHMYRRMMSKAVSTSVLQGKLTNQAGSYEGCIELLNNLQTNAQYIKSVCSNGMVPEDKLESTRKYIIRSGLFLEELDHLSVIHVAGTKGKGTTCAFTESILRNHGYKTGFFSSPHLLEVRERIRINGRPIDKHNFTKCFSKVYKALDFHKSNENDMPLYFKFMTIMAFHLFLEQKVDVAIIEVGIGGEYDCTNVLRKVPVVGITSLGIDHTSLLGSSIESIAWNKAGIMKENCHAFSVPQSESAMKVLQDRSIEKKCHLSVVEPLHLKTVENLRGPADILGLNAGLAIALCDAWISIRRHFLDGAHTLESIAICSKWFRNVTRLSNNKRALMFNLTGNRNPDELLKQLISCNFHLVVFVPNIASKNESRDEQMKRCKMYKEKWLRLEEQDHEVTRVEVIKVFPTVFDAFTFLNEDGCKYDLLTTGSLHLIGAALTVLKLDENDATGS